MSIRTCAADDCTKRFEPYSIDQVYCSPRCRSRAGVQRFRKKGKHAPDGGGGGRGSRRQPMLFPKRSVSAKRLKRERPPETASLFAMFPNGMHEKHAGPVEVLPSVANAATCPVTCYRTFDDTPETQPSTPTTTDTLFEQAAA